MKTALGFFIFFMIGWTFVKSSSAQKPASAYSSVSARAEILAPASMVMKQTQEFDILELPGLIMKLEQYEKNRNTPPGKKAPFLQMNFAEFTILDFSAQQFAVTIPFNAIGLSVVDGKSYISATQSLSIDNVKDERIDAQVFKVTGTLSFKDRSHLSTEEGLSPLIVTVNFN